MLNIWNQLASGFMAQMRLNSKEVESYLPPQFSSDVVEQEFDGEVDEALLARTEEKVHEIEYQIANNEFADAAAMIEEAYLDGRLLVPLMYEHAALIEPIENLIGASQRRPADAQRTAERLKRWYNANPDCALAAACYASALHNVGYSHRGTGWADTVSRDDWKQLNNYKDMAREVFRETAQRHSDHWYWREAYLKFGITEDWNHKDRWRCFEKAIEKQPYSASIYQNFAYQLLPRWHGDFKQLHEVCLHAYRATQSKYGTLLYLILFNQIFSSEEGDVGILLSPEIAKQICNECIDKGDDWNLTLAAALFAWVGEHDRFLETMSQIECFYTENWLNPVPPRHAVSFALQMLKRQPAKQKAA